MAAIALKTMRTMLAIPVVDGDESTPDCMAMKPDYVCSPHASSHRSQREEVILEITAAILKTTAAVIPTVLSMKVKLFFLVIGKVGLVSLLNFAI